MKWSSKKQVARTKHRIIENDKRRAKREQRHRERVCFWWTGPLGHEYVDDTSEEYGLYRWEICVECGRRRVA